MVWWECEIVFDIVIKLGEVGIVICKLGDDFSGGDFLVDGDIGNIEFKGILCKVLYLGCY